MALSIGFSKKNISPPKGVDLCGYGYYLDRKVKEIRDEIWCRTLVLKQECKTVILIVCDLIGFSVEFTDDLRKQISEKHGLSVEGILIACVHTHYGPATMDLEGLGRVDSNYMLKLKGSIFQSVEEAFRDLQPSSAKYAACKIEKISFNRRNNQFSPLDPYLKSIFFNRENDSICMATYSCHPVSYGLSDKLSGDWPSALAQRLESEGLKPIIFQGCSGDVNPVARMDENSDSEAEIRKFVDKLTEGILKSESNAEELPETRISTREVRIQIPFDLPKASNEIEQIKDGWVEFYKNKSAGFDSIPNAGKFLEKWVQRAKEQYPKIQKNPCLENVPIIALQIGILKIVGLPGEVFSEIGLNLQSEISPLMIFGLCGGNIGYIPTRKAYDIPFDYACYAAPQFYQVFPFKSDIEDIIHKASVDVLQKIES